MARFACGGDFASSHGKKSWLNRQEIGKEKAPGTSFSI